MRKMVICEMTKENLSLALNIPGNIEFMEINNENGTVKFYIENEDFRAVPEGGQIPHVLPEIKQIFGTLTCYVDWDETLNGMLARPPLDAWRQK